MFKRKQNKFDHIEQLSSSEKMVNGFAWLSFGILLSRLIGAIYIIFWSKWIGEHYELANSLYAIAYNPYVLFIDFATVGFPFAITKQVSQLNAQNEYKASMTLFKYSALVMIVLGVLSAGAFFFSAEIIATHSVQPTGNIMDNVRTLRTLAPTLLILPFISILRGFFQGYQQMNTPSISQIIEQFVRVGYMLFMTYYVMKIKGGSFVEAVEQSTFAAFVGALASLLFLGYEFYRSYPFIKEKMAFSTNAIHIHFKSSIKTMLQDSIPFVLLSMGTSVLAIMDQLLYRPLMHDFSTYSTRQIAITYAWVSANAAKLAAIISSFTVALSTATLPNIATLYQKGDKTDLIAAIRKTIVFSIFVIAPASFGLAVVSPAIYRVFYADANGATVLKFSAIAILTTGVFSILVAIFQSMNKHDIALKSVVLLLLSKLSVLILGVAIFKEIGIGLSAIVSTSLAVYFLYDTLKAYLHTKLLSKQDWIHLIVTNLTLLISTTLGYSFIEWLLPEFGFITNLIKVCFTAIVGSIVYIIVSLKVNLLDELFPSHAQKIRQLIQRITNRF